MKKNKKVLNEMRKDFIRVCQVIDSCQTQIQLNNADNMIYLFYNKYDDECFEIFIEKQRRVSMLNDLWLKTLNRIS